MLKIITVIFMVSGAATGTIKTERAVLSDETCDVLAAMTGQDIAKTLEKNGGKFDGIVVENFIITCEVTGGMRSN